MRNKFTPCLILALALLTGCAQEAPSTPETPATSVEETTVPETAPETSEALPEVDELPIEINPDASPLEPVPAELSCADQTVEGLVEDTVGYTFALPVFSGTDGSEAMTQFYTDLLPEMETYAKETVYLEAMDRHTVVSVFGSYTVDGVQDGALLVSYEVRAEYGEGDPVTSSRTDHFDLTTGEHLSME